jgi:hypothetical protein
LGVIEIRETFKSPEYKLLPFFRDSRDEWKEKAIDRNLLIKRLKNEVAALRESRGKWKEKAQACGTRMRELEKELEEQKSL